MIEVLVVLNFLAVIGIAWILLRKYRSVGDPGLLWLGGALVLWPLVSGVLQYGERLLMDRLAAGEPLGVYPFSIVTQGSLTLGSLAIILSYLHHLAGAVLILVGVAHLYRARSTEPPAAGDADKSRA